MPNQEMLDRMPEVSQKTLAEELGIPAMTLRDQLSSTQEALIHADCHKRIAALQAENTRLREALKLIEKAPGQARTLARAALEHADGQ